MPMRPTRAKSILFSFFVVAACDGAPVDFGDARRLPLDQRPTVWDQPTRSRLLVEEDESSRQPEDTAEYTSTTPAGWEEMPPQPQRFRHLLWRIEGQPDAECYLTAGVGGGVAGNMMRWYRQFSQSPAPVESLPQVPFGGREGRLLELSGSYEGKPGQAMLLVFLNRGKMVTTLKLIGPDAAVAQNRAAFLELAASIGGIDGDLPASAAPKSPGASPAGPGPDPHHGFSTEPFSATVPTGWRPKQGSAKSLHHTFGGAGEVYVSQLSGEIRPMIGIWRGEMKLGALSDTEFEALPRCEMLGPDALWLDVRGDYQGMSGKAIADARAIVVVRRDGGTIVFAKLIGPAAEVEAELDSFREFCASLRRNP